MLVMREIEERPILFSTDMVRAILEGRKSQTRRVCKIPSNATQVNYWAPPSGKAEPGYAAPGVNYWTPLGNHLDRCPYGQVGDRLWVRETFVLESDREYIGDVKLPTNCPIQTVPDDGEWGEYHLIPHYRATDPEPNIVSEDQEDFDDRTRWTPSIFMPRWASRITLEITGIRVERLQDISHKDALAEGVYYDVSKPGGAPVARFQRLWNSINIKNHPWESNPWIWVIEFAVWDDKSVVIPEGAEAV